MYTVEFDKTNTGKYKGKVKTVKCYTLSPMRSDEWLLVSERRYDEKGNEVYSYRYCPEENCESESSRKKIFTWEHEYDNKGNLIATKMPPLTGQPIVRRYEYDKEGLLIAEYENDIPLLTFSTTLSEKGSKICKTTRYEEGEVVRERTATYDKEGHLIKEYTCHNNESKNTIFYSYDSKGNLIETASYNGNEELSIRKRYRYDEKGNPIEVSIDLFTMNQSFRWYYAYSYDRFGNVIEKQADDQIWAYTYDKDNNKTIEKVYKKSKGLHGGNELCETHKFDSHGNVIEEIYYDEKSLAIRTVCRNEFEYYPEPPMPTE